jgi:zinc/manganese transport system ATP-binding protein
VNAIDLEHLSLVRGNRTVLADIMATIRAGEFIGVFGPNGSGKTSLLHALLGLLQPASGSIRIFGKPTASESVEIGYLPQHRRDVGDLQISGWDFVASAVHGSRWGLPLLSAADRRDVRRTLETVEAGSLAGRVLSEVSGGEAQRLFLAKALLGKPRLLLLDEPLISLDPRFQRTTVALVKRIQQATGMTILFTAHDLNPLLDAMDRVLYLGNGSAALGTVDEVMTSDVLSRLYDMPIEVLRHKGRIVVVSAHGEVEADAHRHHA